MILWYPEVLRSVLVMAITRCCWYEGTCTYSCANTSFCSFGSSFCTMRRFLCEIMTFQSVPSTRTCWGLSNGRPTKLKSFPPTSKTLLRTIFSSMSASIPVWKRTISPVVTFRCLPLMWTTANKRPTSSFWICWDISSLTSDFCWSSSANWIAGDILNGCEFLISVLWLITGTFVWDDWKRRAVLKRHVWGTLVTFWVTRWGWARQKVWKIRREKVDMMLDKWPWPSTLLLFIYLFIFLLNCYSTVMLLPVFQSNNKQMKKIMARSSYKEQNTLDKLTMTARNLRRKRATL